MALEARADSGRLSRTMAEKFRCICRDFRVLETVSTGATYRDGMQTQRWMNQLAQLAVRRWQFGAPTICLNPVENSDRR